ncbi:MAG TPA: DUF4160 domain-containing protein [Isosphaeraceae bacterium]|nr:DUF4160 domain-containing protein [Isosphaeraceae bacterium]
MPKVACFAIGGLTCWFWSNDHDPPHFHIKREGEWELKVKFAEGETQMFELEWGDNPRAKVLREIAKNVKEKRVQLLAEWEAKVNQ